MKLPQGHQYVGWFHRFFEIIRDPDGSCSFFYITVTEAGCQDGLCAGILIPDDPQDLQAVTVVRPGQPKICDHGQITVIPDIPDGIIHVLTDIDGHTVFLDQLAIGKQDGWFVIDDKDPYEIRGIHGWLP